jgi:TRAP-type C4-dicarboxylate transport system permease small subunit
MRRSARAAAVAFALAGGVLLLMVAVVTVISVIGRALLSAPVPGDVELAQLGVAAALALFLPYCQLHGSHLIVDIFTARTGTTAQQQLDRVAQLLVAAVLGLLALRAGVGVADLLAAGETSMVLGLPLWLAYAAMVPSLALAALIALLSAWRPEADVD